jgi:hypothetical protein
MPEEAEIERLHCNECKQATRHAVIAHHVQNGSQHIDDDIEISWSTTYTLLECQGCEAVCLRKAYWFSEGKDEADLTFYPPPVGRTIPDWATDLPEDWQGLLQEVYAALQADSRRLAMMGARAIVDLVLNEKAGDIGGFDQKLNALVDSGYLGRRDRDVLFAALNAGHAAAHRGHEASVEETAHVMDIVENLLHADVLSQAAADLDKSIPRRQKAARPPPP